MSEFGATQTFSPQGHTARNYPAQNVSRIAPRLRKLVLPGTDLYSGFSFAFPEDPQQAHGARVDAGVDPP